MKSKRLRQIVAALVLFITGLAFGSFCEHSYYLFIVAWLLAGYDIIFKALRNIRHGRVFDENFLMSIATIGAVFLQQYSEAAAVMLFYQIGEYFQTYAVNKSRRSIAALMDIRPDYANLRQNGNFVRVAPDTIQTGSEILVKAGEKIPLDGVVVDGESYLDTKALTGEATPRHIRCGRKVLSGSINLNNPLIIKTSSLYEDSTVARILNLVENAASGKARLENFITRFARYYTPTVVIAALFIALLPPLVLADAAFKIWLYRALTFLVLSCPCALVISVPLGFFGGIGAASRNGILVKGGNWLEALSRTSIMAFDKTGTLTQGVFEVVEIFSPVFPKEKLLELAAHADSISAHPISVSLQKAYGAPVDQSRVSRGRELSGRGVYAEVDNKKIHLGNPRLMTEIGSEYQTPEQNGTVVHINIDNVYAGWIRISDQIKPDAVSALQELRQLGVKELVMLSGDTSQAVESLGTSLGIDKVYAGLLPVDKVEAVERLKAEKKSGTSVTFVGDGINDAPVLAAADVGIAMGGLGSDAAVEAADIVLMTDEPSKIAMALKISRRTLRIVRENIWFSLGIKAVVLGLGLFGIATMWEAVFADVGVSILAILNSARALKTPH